MTGSTNLRYTFFYSLLIGVVILTGLMFLPYMITIAVATTFAVVLQPVYLALVRITRGREGIAAVITIIIASILLLGPLFLIGIQIAQEAQYLYERINEGDLGIPTDIVERVESAVERYVPQFNIDIWNYARQSLQWIASNLASFFAGTFGTLLHILLGIMAFFYLVKDGHKFLRAFTDLSPLSDEHDRAIFERLGIAINSIVRGSLLVAIVQGFVSGIGYAIFGLPSPTLWGSITAIGALVPGVGTAIVIAPAVTYLFFAGERASAIGLAIWGAIFVGLIDNLLGPHFVGRGVRIHPLFILFSVIGGVDLFGPLGFILGPLLLSLLYALLEIYKIFVKG